MNLKNNASKSWTDLKTSKHIMLTLFIVTLFSSIAFTAMLHIGGMWDILNTQQAMDEKYIGVASELNLTSTQIQQLDSYKQENAIINDMWKNWFVPENVISLILSFIVISALSLYISCLILLMTANKARNKDSTISSNEAPARKFFWRLLGTIILMAIIIIAVIVSYLILAILLSVILGLASKLLGSIIFIMSIFGLIALVIYIYTRLFFTYPILFMENTSATESLKKSSTITKSRVKELLPTLAFIILVSIPALIISFIGEAYADNPFSAGSIVFNLIYYAISAATSTYLYLLIMNTYLDFNKAIKEPTGTEVADEFIKAKQKKPSRSTKKSVESTKQSSLDKKKMKKK